MRRALLALVIGVVGCGGAGAPPSVPPTAPVSPVAASPSAAPPAPPDPPPLVEGDVTLATVRGMQILVERVPGAEFAAADLFVRGGARNWSRDDAGIERIAFDTAARGGTRALPKEAFSRKLASLGATIDPDVENDFALLSLKAPAASWDEAFASLADAFLSPALPTSEIEVARQRVLAGLRRETEDGDGRLWLLARRMLFAGHPYANRAEGTIETVSALKATAVAPHLDALRDTNRLLLVVVGDVDPGHVLEQSRAAFAGAPRGAYVETPVPPLHFSEARVAGDAFKLPTNYIEAFFVGPRWGDPDTVPIALADQALQERVFEEVRTKRNLSYAPGTFFNRDSATPYGGLYVTTVDPTTTMKVMTDEARRLGAEPLSESELAATKALFATRYARGQETTERIAYALGRAQVLGGDWHLARTILERARATTAAEIQAAAKKYMVSWQTAIVGEPAKLDPKVVGAH